VIAGRQLVVTPSSPSIIEITQEVFNAYYRYMEGLREIISQSKDTDLDGNLSRLPEKALRISALFASLGNNQQIELSHWAKAQAITERWRIGLHELYAQLGAADKAPRQSDEEKVLRIIRLKQSITRREIVQSTKLTYEEVSEVLGNLLQRSTITIRSNGKADVYEIL
jgi:hypothetical protein